MCLSAQKQYSTWTLQCSVFYFVHCRVMTKWTQKKPLWWDVCTKLTPCSLSGSWASCSYSCSYLLHCFAFRQHRGRRGDIQLATATQEKCPTADRCLSVIVVTQSHTHTPPMSLWPSASSEQQTRVGEIQEQNSLKRVLSVCHVYYHCSGCGGAFCVHEVVFKI